MSKMMLMVRNERELVEYYRRQGYESGDFMTLGKRLIADDDQSRSTAKADRA